MAGPTAWRRRLHRIPETTHPPQGRAAPGCAGDAPATMAGAGQAATRRRAVPPRPRAPRPVHLPRQARRPSRGRPFGPPTATNRRSGPGRSRRGGRHARTPASTARRSRPAPGMPAPRERRRALPARPGSFFRNRFLAAPFLDPEGARELVPGRAHPGQPLRPDEGAGPEVEGKGGQVLGIERLELRP